MCYLLEFNYVLYLILLIKFFFFLIKLLNSSFSIIPLFQVQMLSWKDQDKKKCLYYKQL